MQQSLTDTNDGHVTLWENPQFYSLVLFSLLSLLGTGNMQKDLKMHCYHKICLGKAKCANNYFQKETKKFFFKYMKIFSPLGMLGYSRFRYRHFVWIVLEERST